MKHRLFAALFDWPYVWFRVCGYGLHFKPAKGHQPLFSERYGYTKAWYLGPVRIALLKP